MFGGFLILLLFLVVGEFLAIIGVPLPGSVIGMLLLTGALSLGFVRLEQVEEGADTLLRNLAFFFVPPGVGVILHLPLLREFLAPLAIVMIISTALVVVVTGFVAQILLRRSAPHRGGHI
jgi:holin-like protein